MQIQSLYKYYWFGTCVRYLQDSKKGQSVKGDPYILSNLNSFFYYLDDFNLAVTQRASRELGNFRKELDELGEDATLSEDQAKRLVGLMNDVRKTLEAEIEGLEAFIATPKRFSTDKLLNNISVLFAPDVFANLPDIAQYDFAEAGKCIAYERATAAAFHIVRGTESVLRHFYLSMIRRNRISNLMWGAIINDLRKHRKTQKYETLFSNLDNIRVSYRNPTQHPEMVYDIHEAQDLFPLCIEAVNRMIKIVQE